jgi:thymidine phosphorylase
VVRDVPAPRGGWLGTIDTRALGLAVVALGGGRSHPGAAIDPRVGLDRMRPLGSKVAAGEPLARVHAADAAAAAHVLGLVQAAIGIVDQAPALRDPVIERVDAPAPTV